MRLGAIDCGTNSIRLLIAEVADGGLHELHREMRIVRLGQGVDATGEFAPEAIARTRAALTDYTELLARLQVPKVRMVATSATRDAANRRGVLRDDGRGFGGRGTGGRRRSDHRRGGGGAVLSRCGRRIGLR